MKLIISSAPHIREHYSINKIMYNVVIALFPATFAAVYFFGIPALTVIIASVVSAVLIEGLINLIKKEPLTIKDGSAALTGLLLALTLPPIMPIWMIFVGNLVAIGIAKQAFGGMSQNIFNPALTGRIFLMVAYPVTLTTWFKPGFLFGFTNITSATPLADTTMGFHVWDLFVGNIAGSIGETSAIAILIGAAWLLFTRTIEWRMPAGFFGAIMGMCFLFNSSVLINVLAGGALLGGFFMLTDYVTSPVTKSGRFIYGVLTGILVMCIRLWNNMPEGVAFSIVFMNALVPLIDKLTVGLHLKLFELKFKQSE